MNRFPADPLLRFRPEFPILETSTSLISNSLGAMPRAAARALAEYADADAEIDRAFEVIDDVLESGSWKRWSDRGSLVT